MTATQQTIESLRSLQGDYKYGFVTDIESDFAPKGLNEDTVRFISAKKEEPQWLLDWRLKAFSIWQQTQEREPTWARVTYPKIDYQEIYYYAAPKRSKQPESLDEVDPELLRTYEKLGIPLGERAALAGIAVDAVFELDLRRHHFQREAQRTGHHLLPDFRGCTRASGTGAPIPRQRRAIQRQLLCDAELRGVQRWLVRLRAARRALPDGAVDLFPDQRQELGAV